MPLIKRRAMQPIGRIAHILRSWEEHSRLGETDDLDRHLAASAVSSNSKPRDRGQLPLDQIVRQGWTTGQSIDLSNVVYGPAHWKGGDRFTTTPESYYFFLAGLVRSQDYKRIFEIGTHYGGSALAMLRGANQEAARILTIDVTDRNPHIHDVKNITKITGDANTEYVIKKAVTYFDCEPIDLMFIDADHSFLSTMTNIALYTMLLKPRMIVMDDITLNPSMRTMWDVIRATGVGDALNCVDIVPQIRSSSCGFGIVRLRG